MPGEGLLYLLSTFDPEIPLINSNTPYNKKYIDPTILLLVVIMWENLHILNFAMEFYQDQVYLKINVMFYFCLNNVILKFWLIDHSSLFLVKEAI